ncbi:hypothetical protein [Bradyrhizobium sp. BR 1432]|uniref:hypothetical protein n=1 Tax=Bradyrhizobium sp. BR 1432 TaxID=3447966 RepID=UPI003EE4F0C8
MSEISSSTLDSLQELVDRGTAQAAINSLFDDALRGWRSQAYLSPQNNRHVPLALSLGGAIAQYSSTSRTLADAYAEEASVLGATLSATEIGGQLDGLPAIKHHCALFHGDLHGENVRVRAGHAILIDFAGVQHGPLVADPACLETALVLRAAASKKDWRAVIPDLYTFDNLQTLPQPREPAAALSSLWNAVRQIRRFGLAEAQSPNEYATAVAVYLLRHGLRDRDDGEQHIRRPTLVWLAERLTKALVSEAGAGREGP